MTHRRSFLLLLVVLVLLTACAPFDRGVRPPAPATAAARPSPTPTSAPLTPGPPQPTPIAPPHDLVPARTLAFVSDRGGQVDLWLEDIETQQIWRLTDDQAIESFPVWSPDGGKLAYVVEDERQQRNLWLLDLRTGERRQLTHEAPPFNVHRAAWLRGGQALIYDTGKSFDRRPDLRVVTVAGDRLAPLLPDEGSVIYDWATNGTRLIAAVGQPLGEPHLVVTDAVPGVALHPDSASPVGFGVELSPDGRSAVYLAPPLSDNQLAWVLDLTNGTKQPLNATVEGRRYDHDFAWSPDSVWLAYVHGVGGVTDGTGRLRAGNVPAPSDPYVGLYLVDRAGNDRARLTTGSADAAPVWSPDGRWLAYLSDNRTTGGSDIWLIATDPAFHRQVNLTYGSGNNWSPAWMPPAGGGR